jgi:hypothetical protein
MLLYETWNTATAEQDVKHFEDLSAKDILEYTTDPSSFLVTEKLDGSNIIVGRDITGVYTRRHNKTKYYAVEDYETSFFTNYQKATLAAVIDCKDYIESVIALNEEVAAEVIVSLQPNVVIYHRNVDTVSIVLFKTYHATTNHNYGNTGNVEYQAVVADSYTESNLHVLDLKYVITPINKFETQLPAASIETITVFLQTKQNVSGVELMVHEIIDWSLNKRHPAEFNQPWKDVKPQFKQLRAKYRIILKDFKCRMFPSDKNLQHIQTFIEGYVCTNGKVEFKLVHQDAYLAAKNFIWEFRDLLKCARKRTGSITTLLQVDALRHDYSTLVDKYKAHIKETLSVHGILEKHHIRRTPAVIVRDRSAFIDAFDELKRIEHEIRRNNGNVGANTL